MREFSQEEQRFINMFKDTIFVRDQDHLTEFKNEATGLVLNFEQILNIFGLETPKILEEIATYGFAILVCKESEPASTLSNRRNFLGLTIEEVAKKANVSIKEVLDSENCKTRTRMYVLIKIAEVLGLDPRFISIKEGKEELGYLYEV